MAKALKRELNIETGIATFTEVANGEVLECDVNRIFPMFADFNELQKRLVMQTVNNKVGDSGADKDKPKIPQLRETWDNLLEGKWTGRGDGTGGGGGRISDVVTALFNLMTTAGKDATEQQVAEWFAGLSDEEKKDWKTRASVQVEVQNIRDKRNAERKKALKKKAAEETATLPDFGTAAE